MKKSRKRQNQLGVTLIETMIAAAVLGIGSASLFQVLTGVGYSNRRAQFQSSSLDALGSLSAQLRDAPCDDTPAGPRDDPGLATLGVWIHEPTGALTAVGTLNAEDAIVQSSFPIRVQYQVLAGPALAEGPRSLDVRVQVCEHSHPAVVSATDAGSRCDPGVEWTAGLYVREFMVKKICAERETETSRGEYYR